MNQVPGNPPALASEGNGRSRRSLRNLLLDRRFQLRFTLMIVAVSAALTAGLGSLVYHFTREASRVVEVRTMDPTDVEAVALQAEMLRNDRLLLVALIIFGVVLVLVMTGYGLRLTHTVAGPLYKISQHMQAIRDGRLGRLWPLRKGDQLQSFFATFQEMHDALGRRAREDIARLDELIGESERAGLPSLAERLRALKQDKEAFLG